MPITLQRLNQIVVPPKTATPSAAPVNQPVNNSGFNLDRVNQILTPKPAVVTTAPAPVFGPVNPKPTTNQNFPPESIVKAPSVPAPSTPKKESFLDKAKNVAIKGLTKVDDTIKNLPKAKFADDDNFFTPMGFIKKVAQGAINTPAEALQGARRVGAGIATGKDEDTGKQYGIREGAGDVAAAAQLPLMILSFGTSTLLKGGAKEGIKTAILKEGVKQAKIGTGFGALTGIQTGRDIQDPIEYVKNLVISTGIGTGAGAGGGALAAGLSKVVVPLGKNISDRLGAVFVKNADSAKPTITKVNMAPEVAQNVVLANGLEGEDVGKAILKESLVAKNENSHVSLISSENGAYTISSDNKIDVTTSPIFDPFDDSVTRQATNLSDNIDVDGQTQKVTQTEVPQKGLNEGPQNGQVQRSQNITPEAEKRLSSLGLKVEETAIEKKLVTELSDLPEYKTMNMKEQAQMASDLIKNDPNLAIKVALGEAEPPAGLQKESVFKAVENSVSTADLAQRLAKSPLVSEASAIGQRIKALDVKVEDSPVLAIKDVIDARAKAVEQKYGKTLAKATEDTVKEIKKRIKTPDKYDWGKFVESIKC